MLQAWLLVGRAHLMNLIKEVLPGVSMAESCFDLPSICPRGEYHVGHQSCASTRAQDVGGQVGPSMLFSTPSPTRLAHLMSLKCWTIFKLGKSPP